MHKQHRLHTYSSHPQAHTLHNSQLKRHVVLTMAISSILKAPVHVSQPQSDVPNPICLFGPFLPQLPLPVVLLFLKYVLF